MADLGTAVRPVATSRRADLVAALCYLGLAVFVLARLWAHVDRRYLTDGGQDQQQWEWFFAVTAQHVVHLDNPFFTDLQNHPLGVNLMANTTMLGLGIPLTPVTLLFGPSATWVLVLTGGLASTAYGWYLVFSRHLVGTGLAAGVGGGFCGFAPAMISHATSHPNFVVLAVIPLIVLQLVRIARTTRPVRDGVVLGLLVTFQVFLGEETLLLAATGLAIIGLSFAAQRPELVKTLLSRCLPPVALGAGVTAVLVAVPLAYQFSGPLSYTSLEHGPAGNPVEAFLAFSGMSLAGDPQTAAQLSLNPTEQNAFLGLPLVLLVVIITVQLRHRVLVRALAITAAAAAALSLGPEIVASGTGTGIPGPWAVMNRLPFYESVLESRLALVCIPPIGALLALWVDRSRASLVPAAALLLALAPIGPLPLRAHDRPAVPAFFSTGSWRDHVRPGHSVVPVPPPSPADATALRWQLASGLGFALPDGYFVGPAGEDRHGVYGAVPRPTSVLLHRLSRGEQVTITAQQREQARADLAYWRADAVVLPDTASGAVRAEVEELLGPASYADGVWLWNPRTP